MILIPAKISKNQINITQSSWKHLTSRTVSIIVLHVFLYVKLILYLLNLYFKISEILLIYYFNLHRIFGRSQSNLDPIIIDKKTQRTPLRLFLFLFKIVSFLLGFDLINVNPSVLRRSICFLSFFNLLLFNKSFIFSLVLQVALSMSHERKFSIVS